MSILYTIFSHKSIVVMLLLSLFPTRRAAKKSPKALGGKRWPPGILRANRRMRFAECCSALAQKANFDNGRIVSAETSSSRKIAM